VRCLVHIRTAVSVALLQGWLEDPIVIASRTLSDTKVPKGLRHRFIKVEPERKLAVLCRQLRLDLETCLPPPPPPSRPPPSLPLGSPCQN